MIEIRLAKEGEVERQKELWKLCFGDRDAYIDFYFENKYRADETFLLLYNGEIISMLTMMPVRTVLPDTQSFDSAMLYAIGTHPHYRNRGLSTYLIKHSEVFLAGKGRGFSVLVPASAYLFTFYRKQGYREIFHLRENLLSRSEIYDLPSENNNECLIKSISPQEYNSRRNNLLAGSLYTAYTEEGILYQKKLSRHSGADIYAVDFQDTNDNVISGCAVVERRNTERVVIKELLLPEEFYPPVLQKIAALIPAAEYVLRTPAWSGQSLGGTVRPFGMIKSLGEKNASIFLKEPGYLGIAFD